MAPATAARFPVEAPAPDALENEVLDSYDARQKLKNAIKEQETKRKERELDLARSYAKEIHGAAVDVDKAFQANEAWRVDDEKAAQRLAALTNIRSKVDKLLAKHKAENATAVKAALTRRLEALTKVLAEKTDAATDVKEEKLRLEEEIAKLYTAPAGAAPAVAAAGAATQAKKGKKR